MCLGDILCKKKNYNRVKFSQCDMGTGMMSLSKQNIFELCNQLGEEKSWKDLGQEFSSKRVEFQLIPEGDWESRINRLFSI